VDGINTPRIRRAMVGGVDAFIKANDTTQEQAVAYVNDLLGNPVSVYPSVVRTWNDNEKQALGFGGLYGPTDSVVLPWTTDKIALEYRQHVENEADAKTLSDSIAWDEYDNLLAFDVLTFNVDRHLGNVMLHPDENGTLHPIGIDHGYTFYPETNTWFSPVKGVEAAHRLRYHPRASVRYKVYGDGICSECGRAVELRITPKHQKMARTLLRKMKTLDTKSQLLDWFDIDRAKEIEKRAAWMSSADSYAPKNEKEPWA
jgi:hypothetical protein